MTMRSGYVPHPTVFPIEAKPHITVHNDLTQGTEEWFAARRGMVTASVVGRLVTAKTLKPASNDTSRDLLASLVAERITGHTEDTWQSNDMLRGQLDEPIARDLYSEHYAQADICGFMVRDDFGFPLGWSPDGLVGDDGAIEIKSRRQKKQLQTILTDEVPGECMAQCQCALLVSGRKWLDYVSYSGGMPLYVKRVEPDTGWFKAIVGAVAGLELAASQMVADYEKAVDGLPKTERIEYPALGLVF